MFKSKDIFLAFSNFWKESEHPNPESWIKIVARIFCLVLAFYVLEQVLFRITSIPYSAYSNKFIYWEFLKKVGDSIYIPVAFALFFLIFKKRLFVPWKVFQEGKKIRFFVTAMAITLAWLYSTYNYNYYFDQWHAYDRFLLCISVFLIFYRPIFVLFFLSVLVPIIGQGEIIQIFTLAAPILPIRILILFSVFILAKIVIRWFKYRDFVFMVGCLVGVHYFASGIRKVISGFDWLLHDQINYLIPSMYSNGWLHWADPEFISMITSFLGNFNFPLKLFTLSIELGILFMFYNLKLARYCLFGAILMHLGIVLYSGIFFWLWTLVLVLVLFTFLNKTAVNTSLVFTKKYFIISVVLIGFGQFWSRPVPLAWHDTPFNYTNKFFAETKSGTIIELTPKYFAPYIFQFTTGKFKFLNREPRLPILWGATDIPTSSYFRIAKSEEEIFAFEAEKGKIFYNEKSTQKLEDFVLQFISNWNNRYPGENYMDYIQPPRMLLTFPTDLFSKGKEIIVAVKIVEITTFYSEESGYREIRNKELVKIQIPQE